MFFPWPLEMSKQKIIAVRSFFFTLLENEHLLFIL